MIVPTRSLVQWINEGKVKVPNTTTRAPLGRPPFDEAITRSERVVTFLTKDERAALIDLSKENELSISATCHMLISNAIKDLKQK